MNNLADLVSHTSNGWGVLDDAIGAVLIIAILWILFRD